MKKLVNALIILVFVTGAAYAQEEEEEKQFVPRAEVELDYWGATLNSSAKFVEEGEGTEFNMKDDLGMADSGVPGLKLKLFTGPKSDLRFNIVSFGYSGDKRLEKEISFDGESYLAGTPVISSLDVIYYGFGWAWHFFGKEDGTVKFGTLLELKGISMNASLETPNLFQKGSAAINTMFPTFGLSLNAKAAEKLFFLFEFSGFSLGDYGYFVDADIGLRFYPIKNVGISGGYRVFDVEANNDLDFFKFSMSGPYFGVNGRF